MCGHGGLCTTQVKKEFVEAQQMVQAARSKRRSAPFVCRLLKSAIVVVATLAIQRLYEVHLLAPGWW